MGDEEVGGEGEAVGVGAAPERVGAAPVRVGAPGVSDTRADSEGEGDGGSGVGVGGAEGGGERLSSGGDGVPLREGSAGVGEGGAEGESPTETEAAVVEEAVGEAAAEAVGAPEEVGAALALPTGGVPDLLGDADADGQRDADGDAEGVREGAPGELLLRGVRLPSPPPTSPLGERNGEGVGDRLGEPLAEGERVGAPLAEGDPEGEGAGDDERLRAPLPEGEAVTGRGVPHGAALLLPASGEAEGGGDADTAPEGVVEVLGDRDAPPAEEDGAGDPVCAPEALPQGLGLPEGLPLALGERDVEGEPVGDPAQLPDALPLRVGAPALREPLPLPLLDASTVPLREGKVEGVGVPEGAREGEGAGVPELAPLPVGAPGCGGAPPPPPSPPPAPVLVGATEPLKDAEAQPVGERVAAEESEGAAEREEDRQREGVGVADALLLACTLPEPLGVVDGGALLERDGEGERDRLPVPQPDGETLGVPLADALPVVLLEGSGV